MCGRVCGDGQTGWKRIHQKGSARKRHSSKYQIHKSKQFHQIHKSKQFHQIHQIHKSKQIHQIHKSKQKLLPSKAVCAALRAGGLVVCTRTEESPQPASSGQCIQTSQQRLRGSGGGAARRHKVHPQAAGHCDAKCEARLHLRRMAEL